MKRIVHAVEPGSGSDVLDVDGTWYGEEGRTERVIYTPASA